MKKDRNHRKDGFILHMFVWASFRKCDANILVINDTLFSHLCPSAVRMVISMTQFPLTMFLWTEMIYKDLISG